jgi:hypothetical protein
MPASTPQEIHFLFERAFNIGDVEAILALYEPGAVLVAVASLLLAMTASATPLTFFSQVALA